MAGDPIDDFLSGMQSSYLDGVYEKAAKENDLDPRLLKALAKVESGGDPKAKSPKGALGLTQIMPENFPKYNITDPTDPSQVIPATAKMLRESLDKNGGDVSKALMEYHGGPDEKNWGDLTQAYAPKVLAAYSDLGGQPDPQSESSTDAFMADFAKQFAPQEPASQKAPEVPPAGATPVSQVSQQPALTSNGLSYLPDRKELGNALMTIPQVGSSILKGISSVLPPAFSPAMSMGTGQPDSPEVIAAKNFLPPTMEGGLKQAGLIDNPALAPVNDIQKQMMVGAQGAGSGLIFGPAGIVPGIGGAYGGEVDKALGGNGIVGGFLGGVAAGGLQNLAGRAINAVQGNMSEIGQAAQRIGVRLGLTSTTQGGHAGPMEGAGRFLPLGMPQLRAAALRENESLGNAVVATAEKLAPGIQTIEQAGEVTQKLARQWKIENLPANSPRMAGIWAPVRIPGDSPVRLTNFEKTWNNIQETMGPQVSAPIRAQIKKMLPNVSKQTANYKRMLTLDSVSPADKAIYSQKIADVEEAAKTSRWQLARELRSWIGEQRGVPDSVASLGDKDLTRLYAALSEDMRGTAKQLGQLDNFEKANNQSSQLYDFATHTLGKIVKGTNENDTSITPRQAAEALLRRSQGGARLEDLRAEIPAAANALAAATLRESLANGSVAGPSIAQRLSNKQMSPEVNKALFAPVRQQADDIKTVADAMAVNGARYTREGAGHAGYVAPLVLGGIELGAQNGLNGLRDFAILGAGGSAAGLAGAPPQAIIRMLQAQRAGLAPVVNAGIGSLSGSVQ